MMKRYALIMGVALVMGSGCATTATKKEAVEAPVSTEMQKAAQAQVLLPKQKRYKQKVVIGRFTNETNYGKALMTDEDFNRIGKQASDMLASRLIQSQRFLVLERPDMVKLEKEAMLTEGADFIGTDTMIFGSVTEFGRSVKGKSGFLSSTKMQTARAKVEIRLVDARTGLAFFSASGTGEAQTETGEVAGFGSAATYDGTLNDRAIGAAISDVMDDIVSKLSNRPWRTDILEMDGDKIYISGGKMQGLKVDDQLLIMKKTKTVKSAQSGFSIDLPPEQVGVVMVTALFGESEVNEGSVCELTEGSVDGVDPLLLFIKEEGR